MPIRMVDDENDNYSNENENTGGGGGGGNLPGGGGGGGLLQFLPMILGFLIRKPKLLIVALIIGALFFFKGGCGSLLGGLTGNQSALSTGGKLDPEEYKKA